VGDKTANSDRAARSGDKAIKRNRLSISDKNEKSIRSNYSFLLSAFS